MQASGDDMQETAFPRYGAASLKRCFAGEVMYLALCTDPNAMSWSVCVWVSDEKLGQVTQRRSLEPVTEFTTSHQSPQ